MNKLLFVALVIAVLLAGCNQAPDVYHVMCYQEGQVIFDDIVTRDVWAGTNRLYPSGEGVRLPDAIWSNADCIWIEAGE